MRILTLTMEAFGSFIEKTEIDFTQFGDHDLYLISGETGSGKTTIFDAVMFALFGTGSGDERKGAMFRSEYADPGCETFVTLHFRYGSHTYTVTRKPGGYEVAKKRGEGTRQAVPYAELTVDDDSHVMTGDDRVREEIMHILGVNRSQFKQIAMLAQGEFKKLLTEKTENKKLMFRNLFHTGNYDKILQELKLRQDEETETYETSRKNLIRERNNVLVEPESQFYQVILSHQQKEDVGETDAFLALLKDYLKQQETLQQTHNTEQNAVSDELMNLEAEIQENNRLLLLTKQIAQAEEKLPQLNQTQQHLKAVLEQTKNDSEEIHALNQRIGIIHAKLPEYKEFTSLTNDVKEKEQLLSTLEKQLTEEKKKISDNETLLKQLQTEAEKKDAIVESFNKTHLEKEHAENVFASIRETCSQLEQLSVDFEELKKKDNQLLIAMEKFRKQKETYTVLEDAYYASQAGLLARKIQKGKPCPVCGSCQHDEAHIASLLKDLNHDVSKERVDAEKKKKEQLEQKLNKILLEKNVLQGKLDEKRQHVMTMLKNLNVSMSAECNESGISNLHSKMKEQYRNQESMIEELEYKEKEYQNRIRVSQQSQKSYEALREKQTKLQENINVLEKKQTETETVLKTNRQRINMIQNHLEFASEKTALLKMKELQNQIDALQKAEQKASHDVEEIELQIHTIQSQLNVWKAEAENKTITDPVILEEKKTAYTQQIENLKKQIHEISTRMITDQNVLKIMKKEYAVFRQSEEKLAPIRELYRTFNGEYKDRIKIETFIQSEYFERILKRASARMYEMSNGQFELLRKEESDDHRRKEGMEIEVWDYYTNSSRNVATLSGGETFLASLALALGLSDEIQQSAGGIHFDSLFIDEGFGSLDENALSKAIQVLAELSDTDCMIGIISHVSSLMERIEKQIVVTKDPVKGSRVTIHA